ncbi:alpha/beta fold hydrolase [Paraburkholderia sp. MPAMCS5]|uniref:lipase family alpha/beta hydrolase n=1 Tax=Paraburkholderia sp. MPAMCS5 TaxID=3112563 RepID=UPI002E19C6FC|nr:alpha/beta fold hydrolase [Paraburkholderia sp. MPAMCS5]
MKRVELTPPSATLFVLEPLRAAADYIAGMAPLAVPLPPGDGHPVLVFPGLGVNGAATSDLRNRLQQVGYEVHDWEQGVNFGPGADHDLMLERLGDHLKQIHAWHRSSVSLVGWSYGGIYARELAAKHPELVRQVITLATPVADNWEATHVGWLLNMLSSGIAPMSQVSTRRSDADVPVPWASVYSKTDGIVAWEACVSTGSTNHRNIEVEDVSHLGMVQHPEVLRVAAGLLAQHRDGPGQAIMRAAGQ